MAKNVPAYHGTELITVVEKFLKYKLLGHV